MVRSKNLGKIIFLANIDVFSNKIIVLDRTGLDDIFGRIWKRSGKGFGDAWGFLPTSMSSKMDQKQLQAFATVRKAKKHLMFAKAKSRKRENENEIQYSECKTFQICLSAIHCSRRVGCNSGSTG